REIYPSSYDSILNEEFSIFKEISPSKLSILKGEFLHPECKVIFFILLNSPSPSRMKSSPFSPFEVPR
ncbi:Hypothetical predicted protein, partial [Olea europaea subsp. europaea]